MGAPSPEIWHIRGEGGDTVAYALPLPEGLPGRLRSGACLRVNPDGSPWTAPPAPTAAPASVVELRAVEQLKADADTEPVERPDRSARKAEWVAYAVSTRTITRDAAEDLTKAELVARFGERPKEAS
jgi:hypothetical protein